MHPLTRLIRKDMRPALGVTEPGAIAFAAAKARSYTKGLVVSASICVNSGIYKNAYTCGLPHSEHVGSAFAAALGIVAGDAGLELEALKNITPSNNAEAEKMVRSGMISVECVEVTSRIYIRAEVRTQFDTCAVIIQDKHTNIVRIILNGETLFAASDTPAPSDDAACVNIHDFTVAEILQYCETIPIEEISFIKEAYQTNLALYQEGLTSSRTSFLKSFRAQNGNQDISGDEVLSAQLLCSGAIEARVLGLDKPAMSITGSGSHGIICTLPLYAVQQISRLPDEILYRTTALSFLITIYIKEFSGQLSAYCGCGIAAGTGMACAVAWMKKATSAQLEAVIRNMSSSITGMICDGGNHGCTMKSVVAVDAAFRSVYLALDGASIESAHGINGFTPEQTFAQMGQIAAPGMTGTEKNILDILRCKSAQTS